MSSARHDYQRFLDWLHRPGHESSEDTKRFANIVQEHFEVVATNSRVQSRRSVVLAAIAREALPQASSNPPVAAAAVAVGEWTWRALNTLTLGPFRGFPVPETFDFPRQITMFYGPNGSGKTSLCEALELALLGSVDEASAKRIPPQRYFANLRENRYATPALSVRDAEGNISAAIADLEAYRFCFVEKNRIDSFSRIAAKTAGEKKDLIASLFGMQQFHDFVSNFNESMDVQLGLVAIRQQELDVQRATLQHHQATVFGEPQAIQLIEYEEAAYAESFNASLSYLDLLRLIGNETEPGRLHYLNTQLDAPTPSLYGISSNALATAYNVATEQQQRLEAVESKLVAMTDETSFLNLYNAVLALQASTPDRCPACGTPINGASSVAHDPYTQAREGLALLQALANLQNEKREIHRTRDESSRNLENLLTAFAQRLGVSVDHPDERRRYLAELRVDHQVAWWSPSLASADGTPSMAQRIVNLAAECEAADAQTNQALASRAQMVQERDRLVQAAQITVGFQTRRAELARQAGVARQAIADFDQENCLLIEAARQEAEQIAFGQRIKAAYDEFLRLLRQFRAELPGTLIAGINITALEIYNDFNRHDHDGDKLAALHLPINEDSRIELTFRAAPNTRVDALHILSEGHVRCLGVAILLAKALHIQAPTIIFDDAINAIDTEHREGIRETIFQSNRFSATQIIVTCHSSEFIKDLQNHIPQSRWTAYYFMPHLGDRRPQVRGSERTFNYLIQARTALEIGDWRNALTASRQALEMVTERIWKWLGKNELGLITLPIAGRRAEPSLRNLCEALKRRLDDARTFVHQDKPSVVHGLGGVIGVPAPSNVWIYLNKGVHEEADRDDYDPNLVRTIVENLEMLDQLQLHTMPAALVEAAQAAVIAAGANEAAQQRTSN